MTHGPTYTAWCMVHGTWNQKQMKMACRTKTDRTMRSVQWRNEKDAMKGRKEGNMAEGQLNWLSWGKFGGAIDLQCSERVQLDWFSMTYDWWPTICTVLSGFGLVWSWYREHSIPGMEVVWHVIMTKKKRKRKEKLAISALSSLIS